MEYEIEWLYVDRLPVMLMNKLEASLVEVCNLAISCCALESPLQQVRPESMAGEVPRRRSVFLRQQVSLRPSREGATIELSEAVLQTLGVSHFQELNLEVVGRQLVLTPISIGQEPAFTGGVADLSRRPYSVEVEPDQDGFVDEWEPLEGYHEWEWELMQAEEANLPDDEEEPLC